MANNDIRQRIADLSPWLIMFPRMEADEIELVEIGEKIVFRHHGFGYTINFDEHTHGRNTAYDTVSW